MGFDLPDPIESFVENAPDAVQWGGNLIDRLPVQELEDALHLPPVDLISWLQHDAVKTVDNISFNTAGQVTEVEYPNGTTRTFGYDKDGVLNQYTDVDGKEFYKKKNGQWADASGKPTGNTNYVVTVDGDFEYKDKAGVLQIVHADGSRDTVKNLGENAALYPDPEQRDAETKRLLGLIEQKQLNRTGGIIVGDLHKLGVSDVDIWHGSHIQLIDKNGENGDRGALYRKWKQLPGAEARGSSHESSAQQYQLAVGIDNAVVLIGLTEDGDTWLQFEHNASGDVKDRVHSTLDNLRGGDFNTEDAHMQDYNLYRKTNQNVGPFGLSPHTDRNSLHIGV
jgi:YD repeat-containing protein